MSKRLLVAVSVCVALASGLVLADSPHFIGASASIVLSGPGTADLAVQFKEAGLGSNVLIAYRVDAVASATYYCVNGGGNHPKASNKETVTEPVTGHGTFSSGKNGSITATINVHPPGPGSFACPSGQSMVFGAVSYDDVVLFDTTNGISQDIGGPFSHTFISF